MNSQSTDMVYYHFERGVRAIVSTQTWDLQLASNPFSASIRINDHGGAEVFLPRNHQFSAWNNPDTSLMMPLYNSDVDWEVGALNTAGTGAHPDYGWGTYTSTGIITGTRFFVIKTTQGTFKKFRVVELNFYNLTLEFADLNGAQSQTLTIDKRQFGNAEFFMLSLESAQTFDLEPASMDWHIVFRRYTSQVQINVFELVTGVLSHPKLGVAVIQGQEVLTFNDYESLDYDTNNISWIGHQWKREIQMPPLETWQTIDTLAYLAQSEEGEIYGIHFTRYDGLQDGKIVFLRRWFTEQPTHVSVSESLDDPKIILYPNPARQFITLNLSSPLAPTSNALSALRTDGKMVDLPVQQVSNSYHLNVTNIPTGTYLILLPFSDGTMEFAPFIKQ